MTEHLPECWHHLDLPDRDMRPCICDRLSACEARIRADQASADRVIAAFAEAEGRYAAGLDAAREAIVALPHFGDFVDTVDVFAAIDALKEKPSPQPNEQEHDPMHLPECNYSPEYFDMEQNIMWGGSPCICYRLNTYGNRKLDEARESLERMLHEDPCDCEICQIVTIAKALIDALRSES